MGSKKKNKEEKNGPPLFSEGDKGGGLPPKKSTVC
jgi:hypothetical protein